MSDAGGGSGLNSGAAVSSTAVSIAGVPGGDPSADRLSGGRARPWIQFALGVGSLLLAVPPVGVWPLIVLSPLALTLLAVEAPSRRAAFLRLWLSGVVVFQFGSRWLAETHELNLLIVSLVAPVWFGVYGWMARVAFRRGAHPLALPVLWVAHEMLRLNFPLSGYPWLFLGHAVAASPVLVQCADLGGVLLVSFVTATVSGGLYARLLGRRGLATAMVVLAAALGYGIVRPRTLPEPTEGPVLATVQPAFPQRLKDNPTKASDRFAACFELSRQVMATTPTPDLLVWPETMWPYEFVDVPHDPAAERMINAEASSHVEQLLGLGDGLHLLLGAAHRTRSPEADALRRFASVSNSALYFGPTGERLTRYDKHVLVPGGEMMPYVDLLPESWREALRTRIEQYAGYWPALDPGPGPEPGLVELGGVRFGVTICYENAYGSYCREFVRQGARFLVNLSNEGWFGRSSEFDHMELQSVLRAVETRRAVFRSTNSGISSLVHPDGLPPRGADRLEVDGEDRDVRGVFAARIPLHEGRTVYVLWGDWIGWVCLVGALLAVLDAGRRVP